MKKNINEVKHNYEIKHVKTINEWAAEDPFDYYFNCVAGEITHSNLADYEKVNEMFGEALNTISKEELTNSDWDALYVKCAKKVVVDNLRIEADRLEKEWLE